jgi:hypothetical protein
MRHCLMLRAFVAFAAALAAPASAATLNADPKSVAQVFARAKGGDVIVLAPGEYVGIRLTGRSFSPALTLDAANARFTELQLRGVQGLAIRNGWFGLAEARPHPRTGQPMFGYALRMDDVRDITVYNARMQGPGGAKEGDAFGDGYGVFAARSAGVTVEGGEFAGFKTGIVLSKIAGFSLTRNRFSLMRSDGIQVGEGRSGLIEGNICGETRIRDQEHPDCIQLWSRPTSQPTADVVIRGNRARGKMQGIGLFNHVRNGVDDGGFDRITIEDNVVAVGYPHAIALYASRDSVVRNNNVETLPGSKWRAGINLIGGDPQRCGNTVAAASGKPAMIDKPCRAG